MRSLQARLRLRAIARSYASLARELILPFSIFAPVQWNAVARPFLFHFGHRFACRQTDWRKILGIVAGRVDDHFRGPRGGPLLFLGQRGIENNPRELLENLDIAIGLNPCGNRPLDLNRIEGIDVGIDDDDLLDVTPGDASEYRKPHVLAESLVRFFHRYHRV